MPISTMYVAQPYGRGEEGDLVPAEPQQAQSEGQAKQIARKLALTHVGVIAFSRSGDASLGEYDPAKILLAIGEVPSEVE